MLQKSFESKIIKPTYARKKPSDIPMLWQCAEYPIFFLQWGIMKYSSELHLYIGIESKSFWRTCVAVLPFTRSKASRVSWITFSHFQREPTVVKLGKSRDTHFWRKVNDHPSTTTSCVEAKKTHKKNVTVSNRIFGFCVPSSVPSKLSMFIDIISNNIPGPK